MKNIVIVVPCYNEEEMIKLFYNNVTEYINKIERYKFEFIFVDDGSKDNTLLELIKLNNEYDNVNYISFSRNFGKEAAILAGLKKSKGDYTILMDADLQHPPRIISEMIYYIEEGYDSVACKRVSRKGEAKFRSYFSKKFYNVINRISDIEIVEGSTDFRIMSRQMLDSVLELNEYHRFTKGIFEWVGYDTKWIDYESEARVAGETKWSFWGLFKYAIEGIVAFSTAPLRVSSVIGSITSIISFIYFIIEFIKTLVMGVDMPGYASTICMITFLGGIQLIFLGIIGEYLARTYTEIKKRPQYFIKESSENESKNYSNKVYKNNVYLNELEIHLDELN